MVVPGTSPFTALNGASTTSTATATGMVTTFTAVRIRESNSPIWESFLQREAGHNHAITQFLGSDHDYHQNTLGIVGSRVRMI